MKKVKEKIWERLVPIRQAGRVFDIKFWQSQSPTARFAATWSLLEDFYRLKRIKTNARTFRLQRTIEKLRLLDAADAQNLRLREKRGSTFALDKNRL